MKCSNRPTKYNGSPWERGLLAWVFLTGVIFLKGYWPCWLLAGGIFPRGLMAEGYWPEVIGLIPAIKPKPKFIK